MMNRRISCVVAALVTALFALALVTAPAGAAVGGTVTVVKKFHDPRGDWKRRPGTVAIVRYGPFTLPAASMDEPGMVTNSITPNLPAPCHGCFVTDIVPSLVYPDGSEANFNNGAMLHHFVLLNPAERDATCPSGFFGRFNFGDRFFASGSERSHAHLPNGYGYYNASDHWTLIADLMNMTDTPKQVYLQSVIRYRPASAHLKRVRPIWLDINNCGTSEYSIPHGYSDSEWSWTSDLSGYIVGIGGHQHDLSAMDMDCIDAANCPGHGGGMAISAELVGGRHKVYFGPKPATGDLPSDLTGATICRSEDRYNTPFGMANGFLGHLDTMTLCGLRSGIARTARGSAPYPAGAAYRRRGFPLKAGQTIRLHSQYTNPGEPRDDVMGIMVAYLHPSRVR
jgi:hypothetical protein